MKLKSYKLIKQYVCLGNLYYFGMTISKQGTAAPQGSALTNVGFKLRYNAGFRYRVGQFSGITRGIPGTDGTSGMKVTAHTNGLIYNTNGKGDQYRVALRSGICTVDVIYTSMLVLIL